MAKFGQGFLQALTQPSYGQGLFQLGETLGSTPGRLARLEKMKGATPEQLAQMEVDAAMRSGDPAAVLRARGALSQVRATTARQDISGLEVKRQAAVDAGDWDLAESLEKQMEERATAGGLSFQEIRTIDGATASALKANNDALWQAQERADQNREKMEASLVEQTASEIAYGNQPIATALEDERLANVPRSTIAKIEKRATEIRDRRVANMEARDAGKLKPAHHKALKENPQIAQLPEVQEALRILNKDTNMPHERKTAVATITAILDKEAERQHTLKYGKENREGQAVRAVDFVTSMKSRSTGPVFGRDLPELIQDKFPPESEAREDLEDAIVYILDRDRELLDEQGNLVSAEEAVKRALVYLQKDKGIDVDLEAGRQAYVAGREKEQELFEAAVQELVDKGVSRSSAERRISAMTRREGVGAPTDYVTDPTKQYGGI